MGTVDKANPNHL